MTLRHVLTVGIMALLVSMALPAMAWEPDVNGYSQFRYEYSAADDDGDFDTRRVRLNWKDTVNEQGTTFRIQLDFSDLLAREGQEVSPRDIWLSHPFAQDWSARVGYGTVMFGYELEYSSSKRLPFERARVTRTFFPGERGLGVFATYHSPEGPGVNFDLGVIDGMDDWHRDRLDDATSFVANAEVPFGGNSVAGVSYMTSNIDVEATGTDAAVDFDPSVWGAHVRWNGAGQASGWALQAEYMDGDWYDHRNYAVADAGGWYGLVEYAPDKSDATIFYRYDELDISGQSDYSRHTIGTAWEVFANNRVTLQIEDIDDGGDGDTTVGVQWQVIYK